MNKKREPIKKSSIEKKKKIIEKGFELICEKGYHNVSCVDIAKYAEVSTGIIYQYFDDKRDVFIEGVKLYSNQLMFPMLDIIKTIKNNENHLKKGVSDLIDEYIKQHKISPKAHEELMAMSWSDEEVATILKKNELEITRKIAYTLETIGLNTKNLKEKVHIIYGLIDNYCHEVIYHKHQGIDYKIMKEDIIDLIIYYLK